MQITIITGLVAVAISSIIGAVVANPLASPSPDIYSRDAGIVTWKGVIEDHEFELQGTATQVVAQLEALYPGIVDRVKAQHNETTATDIKRRNKSDLYCIPVRGQDWQRGYYDGINEGISDLTFLGHINGGTVTAPGPGCVQLHCQTEIGDHADIGGSEIVLCNDRPYEIFPNAGYIASYAQDLVNQCTRKNVNYPWTTGGQEFDTDGYNVITKWREPGC